MSKSISTLNVALTSTVAPFANGLKAGEKAIGGFIGAVGDASSKLLSITGIATLAATTIGGVFALGKGFSLAAQFETANVQLTALTGSANNAHVLLGQLRDFAKSSPFEFPELLEASKKLMAVGVSADAISPLLKQVGEVAAGTGSDIASVADIFVKVAAEGKVTSKELKEFGKDGIPIVQTLAKQFNTTAEGVAELADNGTIGFAQLQAAFGSMTGAGGRFNGILAAQANTIGGVWKSLSGTLEEGSANIAESLLRAFNVAGWLPKVTAAVDGLTTKISSGLTAATPYIQGFINGAVNAFAMLYDMALPIWNSITGFITDNWQSIFATAVTYGVAMYDEVTSIFGAIVDIAEHIWDGLTTIFVTGWDLVNGETTDGANQTQTTVQGLVSIFNWLGDAISTVLGTISYGISHFGDLCQLVTVGAALKFVTFGNQVAWVFTDVIGTSLVWVGSQIASTGRFIATVFENIGGNIVSFFSNIPGLIKGSVSFSDVWKPLTEGFKETAEDWPGIAERQAGPLEKALTGQFSDLSDQFGEGLGNHLATNAQKAADIVKGTTDGIKKALEPAKKLDKPEPIVFDAKVNPSNMTVSITPELKKSKALMSGGAESLAARYTSPYGAASGASGPLAASGTQGGSAPAPKVGGVGSATASVQAASDKSQQEQLTIANQWLYRIELNTRGTSGSVGASVVSLA